MNFHSYLTTTCPCGSTEPYYYFCTDESCKQNGFICADCQFFNHSAHSQYCIPLKLFQLEPLSKSTLSYITSYKNTLIQAQTLLNSLFTDEINFFSEMELITTNYSSNIVKYNLLPLNNSSPPIQSSYSITSESISNKIKELIISHNENIKAFLNKQLTELKPSFLNEHIIQIVKGDLKLYNGAIYKEKSNAHTFTMKFIPNNEIIFLKGIGFNSRALFGVLKSDFMLTIKSQRFFNEKLLLTLNPKEHVIVNQQYQDINFVMIQHPIKMERNVQYEISLTRTNNDTLINDDDNNNSVQQIGKKTYYQNDLYSPVFDFQNEQFVLSNEKKQCNIYTHLIYIKI